MKKFSEVRLGLSLALLGTWFALTATPNAQTSSAQTARNPVVIELFTSEGCSSCPSADRLLQKLEARGSIAGAQIIALEEHVDYWNHDGWVDPYSSREWTERQEAYVAVANNDPYTPELVVDGRRQFVGNDASQAEAEIVKAARDVKTQVSIAAGPPAARGERSFSVSVGRLEDSHLGDTAEVWLAITEDGLRSSVDRGENAGSVLQHVATLRALRKIGVADASAVQASFQGNSVVRLNPRWDLKNVRVTVFVQYKRGREILGAAATRING